MVFLLHAAKGFYVTNWSEHFALNFWFSSRKEKKTKYFPPEIFVFSQTADSVSPFSSAGRKFFMFANRKWFVTVIILSQFESFSPISILFKNVKVDLILLKQLLGNIFFTSSCWCKNATVWFLYFHLNLIWFLLKCLVFLDRKSFWGFYKGKNLIFICCTETLQKAYFIPAVCSNI